LSEWGANSQTETDIKDLQAANGTTEAWVASIPASYPTSPIDVKDSQTIFGSDASSQQTNANVNKYDFIYFEVANFATSRACRIFFWDPNQNTRIDWYLRPVDEKDKVDNWAAPANVTGNGTYCVKIPNGARLQGAKTPWVQSSEAGTLYQFSKIYVIEPDDPLAGLKDILQQAIDKGKLQNSFAKTTDSWTALQTAISHGEAEYASPTDEATLTAKTNAINDAIAGLKLQDGYTNLTSDMFKLYSSVENPGEGSALGTTVTLFAASDLPYGDASVGEKNWADMTTCDKFIILTVGETKPRLCMNRLVANGQQAETQADSKMLDINPNNDFTWSTEKYQTIDGNSYTIDLKKIVDDYGFARLHSVKKQGWGAGVTVTDFLLHRTVDVAEQYATFGSLYKNAKLNGVKAYAAKVSGSKVVLTEVANVPAGKGVVVEAAAAGSFAPTFDVDADDIDSELLVSNGTVTGDGTIFVLATKNTVTGFYKLANGQKVPAGKAYLKITTPAPEFLPFEGAVTGIETVKAAKANNEIFNLAGQRVAKTAKGLYIVNGKKVVVK
jgi:hypothetical protein